MKFKEVGIWLINSYDFHLFSDTRFVHVVIEMRGTSLHPGALIYCLPWGLKIFFVIKGFIRCEFYCSEMLWQCQKGSRDKCKLNA